MRVLVPVLLLATGVPATASAQGDYDLAAPEEALGFVYVRDVRDFKRRMLTTPYLKVLTDPAMDDFNADFAEQFAETVQRVRERTGVEIDRVLKLDVGQLALMVLRGDAEEQTGGFVLALDVAEDRDDAVAVVEQVVAALEKDGYAPDGKSGELFLFRVPANRLPTERIAVGVDGDVLVVTSDVEAAERFVGRVRDDAADGLADTESYRDFRDRIGGPASAEVFVDWKNVLAEVERSFGGALPPQARMLGVDTLVHGGFAYTPDADEFADLQQHVLVTDGPSPLLRLLTMPPTDLRPEEFLPAEMSSYLSGHWDFGLAWETLQGILRETNPGVLDGIDGALASVIPENPPTFEADVIEPLGDRLTTASQILVTGAKPVQRSLLAWQLNDGPRLTETLDRLLSVAMARGAGGLLQRRTIGGATFYAVPLEQFVGDNPTIDVGTIAFGVAKSHFLFASHVELLERTLSADGGAGLAETPEYEAVARHFPARTSAIRFAKTSDQLQVTWRMVRSEAFLEMWRQTQDRVPDGFLAEIADGFADALDPRKLPDFERVAQHLTPAGGYLLQGDDGLHYREFRLRP